MPRTVSFGGGLAAAPQEYVDPQRFVRQRAMADALIGQSQGPISGWGEGVGNLAKTAAGLYAGHKADEGLKSANAARLKAMQGILASDDPMAAFAQSGDPELVGMGLQAQMANLLKGPGETYATLTDEEERAAGLDPAGTYQRSSAGKVDVLSAAPKPAEDPGAVREYNFAVGQGYKGSFLDFQLEQKKAAASTSTTNVTVAGDKKNAETIGEYWGEKLGGIMDAGFNAPKTIAKYQRLGALLDQAGSGTFVKTGVEFKKALKGAGLDPEAFGITDNTAPADAAEAITNQLAMEMRNPAGGAGMPGAMSDSDRQFLQNTVANLGKTPGGNKLIIEAAMKMAERDGVVAKMANDYATRNGGIIDGGFFDQLQQFSDANPLFADMPQVDLGTGGQADPGAENPYSNMSDEELLRTLGVSQ